MTSQNLIPNLPDEKMKELEQWQRAMVRWFAWRGIIIQAAGDMNHYWELIAKIDIPACAMCEEYRLGFDEEGPFCQISCAWGQKFGFCLDVILDGAEPIFQRFTEALYQEDLDLAKVITGKILQGINDEIRKIISEPEIQIEIQCNPSPHMGGQIL